MKQNYRLMSFYLALFCFGLTSYSFYSYLYSNWLIAPPIYILLLLSIIAFIYGLKGLDKEAKWLLKIKSWITIILPFILTVILTLGLFFSLLLSAFGANERIETTHSPDGIYTIDIYRWDAGAAGTFGVKGELNGPLWTKKRIYYQKRVDNVEINWINNFTVTINGYILNLKEGETYGY